MLTSELHEIAVHIITIGKSQIAAENPEDRNKTGRDEEIGASYCWSQQRDIWLHDWLEKWRGRKGVRKEDWYA